MGKEHGGAAEEKDKTEGGMVFFIMNDIIDHANRFKKKLEEKRRKQIMTSIQKNVQQAKATGDDKRYGQVASRKKVRQFNL